MKKIQFLFLSITLCLIFTACKKNGGDAIEPPIIEPPTNIDQISTLSVSTFAGGGLAQSVDGTGTNAQFYQITKLTSDKTGNLYVLEAVGSSNLYYKIRQITPSGATTTLFNGGSQSFVNNQPVNKSKIYFIRDIASDPMGNLYVLANMIDYSTVSNSKQSYYQEMGTYKYNPSTKTLDKFSVSSSTTGQGPGFWAAPYNLLDNITTDGAGNLYGDYITGNGTPGTGKVYKITLGTGSLITTIENLFPESLYAEGNQKLYAQTTSDIISIGVSNESLYKPGNTIVSYSRYLIGNKAGTLYAYGNLYNSAKEIKGVGFYKFSNGKITNAGKISGNPIMHAVTSDQSGNIYYAIHTDGFVIYKVKVD